MTSTYVSVRDDGGTRSLSTSERDFLRSCALAESGRVLRGDGRGPGEVRKVKLTLGRWHNGAECSVQWGVGTRVTAVVTGTLLPPSPERPSEGTVSLSVDLSPMASTSFGHAQPVTTTPGMASGDLSNITDEAQRLLSNRILRSLERTLLIGGALDTEALCVQSGAWVWRLNVSVTLLDSAGNSLDAAVLAAVAALRHYRKPQVNLQTQQQSNATSPTLIHSDMREPTPLPLHHTPLSISFALIHADDASLATASSTSTVAVLVDPTDREELVQTGSISLAMNVHSEVCLLDFGGGCELQPTQLKQCWQLAEKSILQLCRMLENTLTDADEKAQQERLQRLQASGESFAPSTTADGIPFVQDSSGQDFMQVDTNTEWKDVAGDVESAEAQVNEEEEAYRLQALDYSQGHVAAKVKDKASSGGTVTGTTSNKPGSLLEAMLQSVKSVSTSTSDAGADDYKKDGDVKMAEATVSDSGGTRDLRSQEAQDEFEQFAKKTASKAKASASKKQAAVAMDSDDEEETTTVLQSEFQSVPDTKASNSGKKATTKKQETPKLNDDDDIDDLAMAIKSKKKKKTKKSK